MSQPQITQFDLPPDMIDLGLGDPDLSLLPVRAINKSAEGYFKSGDPRSLQYGIEQGNGFFRRSLANYLSSEFESPVDPDRLFISAGASSGLDLICTLNTEPGDTIFVEEPTYFLALKVFKDHGLLVESVPVDEHGINMDALAEKLTRYKPKFIYIIPAYQNPTGSTLSLERRNQLIEFAQQHGFLIVADEVYQLLYYEKRPPKPLAVFSEEVEQVISVNSFSKILSPGLRLGWIQAHPEVIGRITGSGLLDSGGGMNPFVSALLLDLVESGGLKRNVEVLRHEYSKRLNVMGDALKAHLPSAVYVRPQGGFFYWVRLPGMDTVELARRAKDFNAGFRPGVLFSSRGSDSKMKEYLRLSFCYYQAEEITEGVRRISNLLDDL